MPAEVKKQTVKNKIHALKFPENMEKSEKKRELGYLYIEADEDHASLQFREKKGDLAEGNHHKNNCLITKLIYVHEGIEKEAPESKRHKLVNPHYNLDKVKKIYPSTDGGGWIKSGMKRIAGITYVLDELRTAVRSKNKKDFEGIVERLEGCLKNEEGTDRIAEAKEYILSNWTSAKLRLRHQNGVKGSNTEGHVSHVLSSRMSSRPRA